jgi:hypothetical protein
MLAKLSMVVDTETITQETSDNVEGFVKLATRMKNLQPIFSKMEVEGASLDVVHFLEKLEACVP